MSVVSTAVQTALNIANDNSHGYDQGNRWGPDYDCSSLVITAYKKAGVPLSCTYTGNMLSDMLTHGFRNVTSQVTLATGAGLLAGDVLLNVVHHTAMYIGNGQLVQASINEMGGVSGGRTGDQTGAEISTRSYFNFPWNYVLRYEEQFGVQVPVQTPTQTSDSGIQNGTYTVKSGDSLWSIAARFYGSGAYYTKIMSDNGLTSSAIKPGQVLKIGSKTEPVNVPSSSASAKCTVTLPVLKYGDNGMAVRKIQALLAACGYSIDVDGDFGSATKNAIEYMQRAKGISVTGNVDAKTYEVLLS